MSSDRITKIKLLHYFFLHNPLQIQTIALSLLTSCMLLHTLNSQFGFSFKALHIHTFLLSVCYSNCYFISVLWFTSHQQKVLSFSTTSFFSFSVRLTGLSISPFLPATALRTVCTVTLRTVNQRFIVLTSARKGSSSHHFWCEHW